MKPAEFYEQLANILMQTCKPSVYRNEPLTKDLGYAKWMLANNKDLDADLRWSLEKVLA